MGIDEKEVYPTHKPVQERYDYKRMACARCKGDTTHVSLSGAYNWECVNKHGTEDPVGPETTENWCQTCQKVTTKRLRDGGEWYECTVCYPHELADTASSDEELGIEPPPPDPQTQALEAVAKGRKMDDGKADWTLLPLEALEGVVRVLEYGVKKYDRDSWQHVPDAKRIYAAAAMRHRVARQAGELLDPEDGLPHLDHELCCLIFLSWFERKGDQR